MQYITNMIAIIVDTKSYKFDSTGMSTGVIYMEIENQFFPDPVWNDFPEVILSWWLEGFSQLLTFKEEGYYEFLFMDGPCKWVVDYSGNEIIQINCYRYDKIEHSTHEKLSNVIKVLRSVANDFLRFCNENHFENEDLKTLEKNFKKLQLKNKQLNRTKK